MGRNAHRRAADFERGVKNAEHYATVFDLERRNHEAWQSLSFSEQIDAMNAEHARRSPITKAINRTTTCQMPGCDNPTIRRADLSLGVCYNHGVDIAVYFDAHGEDFKQQVARVGRAEAAARADRLEQRKAESRRLSPGWIYYLQIADRIKIGYSIDVKRRLKQYPPDSPLLALHPGTKQLESEMHAKFVGSKAAGREWFLDTTEIRDHIREVVAQFGEPDRARYEHRGKMHTGLRAAPPKPTGISR